MSGRTDKNLDTVALSLSLSLFRCEKKRRRQTAWETVWCILIFLTRQERCSLWDREALHHSSPDLGRKRPVETSVRCTYTREQRAHHDAALTFPFCMHACMHAFSSFERLRVFFFFFLFQNGEPEDRSVAVSLVEKRQISRQIYASILSFLFYRGSLLRREVIEMQVQTPSRIIHSLRRFQSMLWS